MSDRLGSVVARARDLVAELIPFVVEKGIWGSPMGKTHLAQRIAVELPEHRVYVEPFAGGAQVLFAKDLSEVEVVSDIDPEIAFAFKFAKGLTAEQLTRLRRKSWVGDKEHFKKLVDAGIPSDDVERFYRFAYLTRFGFNKLRRGTMPDKNVGVEARFVDKLEQWAPRLKAIRVRSADYEKVIDEFDGKDAFFFLEVHDRSGLLCSAGFRLTSGFPTSTLVRGHPTPCAPSAPAPVVPRRGPTSGRTLFLAAGACVRERDDLGD